jgi:hypothetical protein
MLPNPDRLGRTEPNAAGRTYGHGTLGAYTAGRCRCEYCRNAFAHYVVLRAFGGWLAVSGQPLSAPLSAPTSRRCANTKMASAGIIDSAVKANTAAVFCVYSDWKVATASGSV